LISLSVVEQVLALKKSLPQSFAGAGQYLLFGSLNTFCGQLVVRPPWCFKSWLYATERNTKSGKIKTKNLIRTLQTAQISHYKSSFKPVYSREIANFAPLIKYQRIYGNNC